MSTNIPTVTTADLERAALERGSDQTWILADEYGEPVAKIPARFDEADAQEIACLILAHRKQSFRQGERSGRLEVQGEIFRVSQMFLAPLVGPVVEAIEESNRRRSSSGC